MSLNDEREWRQRTAAGQLAEAMGVPVGARCPANVVEAHVREAQAFHAEVYGHQLDSREIELVRLGAELRYRPEPARQLPADVPSIVAMVNHSVIGAGWRYVPEFAGNQGMAMRNPDGSYSGDAGVIGRVTAAEAARRDRLAHVSNIATDYHVGPPT